MSLTEKQALLQRIDSALDDVRPHLAVDGGNVEVKIKWLGACEGCSMTSMTMRAGIEQAIISRLPEITGVMAVNGVEV